MSLYRLDNLNPDGALGDPVLGIMGVELTRRWALVRDNAKARAKLLGAPVAISRIDGRTLRVTHAYTAHPNGHMEMKSKR